MSDRELKLNSLSRYKKDSPRFILEAQGHCEVPAGCGGVVLRWWNPSKGVPVEIRVYAAGEYEFFIDGKTTTSGRPMVSYGQHVFAFRIRTEERAHGILMFSGIYDEAVRKSLSRKTGTKISIVSAAGQGWRYTLSDPGEKPWMLAEFDDSKWRDMLEQAASKPSGWNGPYSGLIAQKVPALAVAPESKWSRLFKSPQSIDTVWVRKAFSL